MKRMQAGWRLGRPNGMGSDGEPAYELPPEPGKSLFETIEQSGLPDDQVFVVCRRELVFALLNIYPYNPGHVMVLPKRAVPSILELSDTEHDELWALVRDVYRVLGRVFEPQGMNVGVNEGVAGGASQPDHLHVHIVPRWLADTSFATSIADTRILPITLHDSWTRIRAAWPDPLSSDG